MSPQASSATCTYTVEGMTRAHCVMSVRDEGSEVAGVGTADVDLPSGRLVVSGAGFSDEAVRVAVAEAGHEVVS